MSSSNLEDVGQILSRRGTSINRMMRDEALVVELARDSNCKAQGYLQRKGAEYDQEGMLRK